MYLAVTYRPLPTYCMFFLIHSSLDVIFSGNKFHTTEINCNLFARPTAKLIAPAYRQLNNLVHYTNANIALHHVRRTILQQQRNAAELLFNMKQLC